MSLQGKTLFITGASRGIGLAIGLRAARDGANIAIAAKTAEPHPKLPGTIYTAAEAIERAGGKALPLVVDVRDEATVKEAIDATAARFGGLDIVVNNAGVGIFGDVATMTAPQWSEVIDTNLTGVYYVCHAAIPHLRRRGGGFIVNISSLAGKNPFVDGAAYCASKAGLNAFSEALMQEVRHDGIRVAYVLPGSVATGFSSGDPAKGAEWKIAPEEVAEVVLHLLQHPARSLPSRVELRPSRPPRK